MLEYIRSLIFKCELVGVDVLVHNELRIYYALFYVYWVKVFVMEVSMSISGFCICASVYIYICSIIRDNVPYECFRVLDYL